MAEPELEFVAVEKWKTGTPMSQPFSPWFDFVAIEGLVNNIQWTFVDTNGDAVEGVSVDFDSGTYSATSDENGYVSLWVPPGSHDITVSKSDYQAMTWAEDINDEPEERTILMLDWPSTPLEADVEVGITYHGGTKTGAYVPCPTDKALIGTKYGYNGEFEGELSFSGQGLKGIIRNELAGEISDILTGNLNNLLVGDWQQKAEGFIDSGLTGELE